MMEHPELTIMVQELRRSDAIRTAGEHRVAQRPGVILFVQRVVNAVRTRPSERKSSRESSPVETLETPPSIAHAELG